MQYDLSVAFTRALQDASEVGGNSYLALLSDLLRDIQSHDGADFDGAKRRLHELLSIEHMALDGRLTTKFIEELGEAHFHVLANRSGLDLQKIPETNQEKTPDFQLRAGPDIYFEVKTPSIAAGEFAMREDIEDSWRGRVDLQDQLDAGRRVALVEQMHAPYGPAPHEKRRTHVIAVLQDKLRNNLKRDQFAKGPTYLVASLLLLHPYGGTDGTLRPVYRSRDDIAHYASGHLWMTVFSDHGMLIHSEPEFDGAPAIEGRSDRVGILVGDEYDFVEGIIFVIYDLNGYSRMVCLVRSDDQLNEPVATLVGPRWNDCCDSNGSQLTY